MKLSKIIFIILLLPAVFLSCIRDTEEDKVKKVITRVQQAAEEKKINGVLDHVSKSYKDPQENDYNAIKGLLAFYFFQHQRVSIYVPNVEVTVTGLTAKAGFQAILTGHASGEATGGVLPEKIGVYNFTVQLAKEDGAWKVTSAAWERAGEGVGQQ